MTITPQEIADVMFEAFSRGDVDTLRTVCAPDAEVWHNFDRSTVTVADNVALVQQATTRLTDLRYDDVRREFFADGFVQQHVLHATTLEGGEVEVDFCMVVRLRGGLVCRIDEYVDLSRFSV